MGKKGEDWAWNRTELIEYSFNLKEAIFDYFQNGGNLRHFDGSAI